MEPSPSRVAAETADLLSSFPEHLLDEILRRLDLRDAVRTSALSRAWRRRWESVPGLALSFPDGTPACAVDRVLLRYTCLSVSRFSFHHLGAASASHVDDWLIALSRRRVEAVSIRKLHNYSPQDFILHSSIFSCARLVSLDLHCCAIPPLPMGFAGFPVLEELYLSHVDFNDYVQGQLQAIIRGSPLLRVLYLDEVSSDVDCLIESPNLCILRLKSFDDYSWQFGELPCLQDAKILVVDYSQHEDDFGGFLAGLAQVRELTLYSPSYEINIDTTTFTFYNLKSLEFVARFTTMNPFSLMFYLLRSSPNLEKLKIELVDMQEPEMITDWEFLNAQWTDGMCANLQIVQIISDPIGRCLPISFLKLILSKACLLRTLSVNECPSSQDDPLNEILTCRRASAQAQVLFKVQLERFWKP